MPRLLLAILLGISLACAGAGPAPPAQSGAPPPSFPRLPSSPGPQGTEQGERLLEKFLAGLGGAAAVDRVVTLELKAEITVGNELESMRASTWIFFPDRYRQVLTTRTGDVETVLSPKTSFVRVSGETLPIEEARRLDIERTILRNPVALAKTRGAEVFRALGGGASEIDGVSVDLLILDVGGEQTTLALDQASGRLLRLTYRSRNSAGVLGPETTLSFRDHRQVDGLVYPFEVSARVESIPTFRARLSSLVVNGPVDDATFQP